MAVYIYEQTAFYVGIRGIYSVEKLGFEVFSSPK